MSSQRRKAIDRSLHEFLSDTVKTVLNSYEAIKEPDREFIVSVIKNCGTAKGTEHIKTTVLRDFFKQLKKELQECLINSQQVLGARYHCLEPSQ